MDNYTGRKYSRATVLATKYKTGFGGATVMLCLCRCDVCAKIYSKTATEVDEGRANGCNDHRTPMIDIDHEITANADVNLLFGVFIQAMIDLDDAIRHRPPGSSAYYDKIISGIHEYVETQQSGLLTTIMRRVEKSAEKDIEYSMLPQRKRPSSE